jgi:hypothetical protein
MSVISFIVNFTRETEVKRRNAIVKVKRILERKRVMNSRLFKGTVSPDLRENGMGE